MNSKRVLHMRMWVGGVALAGWMGITPLNTSASSPFALTCATNKTVEFGTPWHFDPPLASGEYVYDTGVFDNATNDLLLRFQTGTTEMGDEIALGGTARHLTSFVFEYYGSNTVLGYQFASANVHARVRFYMNDGPLSSAGVPRPGTVFFDSGEFGDDEGGLQATPRSTVLFDQENLRRAVVVPLDQPLPVTFTWTVQFSGLGANDQIGVDIFSPPVIGSSFPDYWERVGLSWILKTNATSPINFAAQFYAADVQVAVTSSATNRAGFCGETFEATRTWRATNDHSQTSECSQTVTVVDTTPPILLCAPAKTVGCGQPWTFDAPTVSNACVFNSLIYDNSRNDRNNRFNPGTNEVGDEIILDGTARFLTQFVFEYWGTNSSQAQFVGNVQARLRFYASDGPDFNGYPTPGTVLYDSDWFPINTTPRSTLVFEDFVSGAFKRLSGAVPPSFTWSVQFSGLGPTDSAGVDVYSPPVVGDSFADYWERTDGGWVLKTNALGAVDFAALALATDEPSEACVFSSMVYNNSLNDLTNRFNPGSTEVGDEVFLAGKNRFPTQFIFEYWGTNATQSSFVGTVEACVRFYANDGTSFNGYPRPKTVLYDSGYFPVGATPRATLIIDDFVADAAVPLSGPVPQSFTWTVQFRGLGSGDAAGVDLYSPAVLGTSFPDYWERTSPTVDGWRLINNETVAMDFAAQLFASETRVDITGTVTNVVDAYSYMATRTWTVTDACGNSSPCSQTVTVACPSIIVVTGQVELEGFVGTNRTVTFIATNGANTKTWTLPLSFSSKVASYALIDVPPGTTHVSAKTAWNLREKVPIALSPGQATANFLSDGIADWNDATDHYLRGGDLNGDNNVIFNDYFILATKYFTANPLADITGDGVVNFADYLILAVNYFTGGDSE